ncbi:MAG TPA: DUF3089 domain-containing protein [Sphingomonadaceae bacterium]|jgi:hypothetical protein|nr:DUF3089 domain-containing protein [Sphingomonadaceae bacterium]
MLARRFLFIVAGLIVLVIAAALAYRLLAPQLMEAALVPSAKFEAARETDRPDYGRADLWISRPGIANDPALWTPAGVVRAGTPPRASVFFIHPTSYLSRRQWNAPVDEPDSANRARLFVRSQASVFNDVAAIWAPRYRQATFGAFLTSRRDAELALDFAYKDVEAAFDRFLAEAPKDRPIILAAHSQGSLHLTRLLRTRVAGTPLARRIAAAYAVGWPISVTADLQALGLPACRGAADAGCVLSWQSFGEPADPSQVTDVFEASQGFNGTPRRQADMLCVNPLTGNAGDQAPASANLGTLKPNADLSDATMVAGAVAARCADGLLLLGPEPPNLGPYVLPGNNYHVFDYALFWANVRTDAARRLAAFEARP